MPKLTVFMVGYLHQEAIPNWGIEATFPWIGKPPRHPFTHLRKSILNGTILKFCWAEPILTSLKQEYVEALGELSQLLLDSYLQQNMKGELLVVSVGVC